MTSTHTSSLNGSSSLPERRGIYFLTLPRSASNLFETMMAKQPGFQNSSYKLFQAGFPQMCNLGKGPLEEWPENERKELYEMYAKAWEALQDEMDNAKINGKLVFSKEHVFMLYGPDKMYGAVHGHNDKVYPLVLQERNDPTSRHNNPTSVPDNFLLTLQPVFQIRHPALSLPSMVRAQSAILGKVDISHPMNKWALNIHSSRELYDWYVENTDSEPTRKPRIMDADDLMSSPASVRQLCVETGMDPDAVQYTWETRSAEELGLSPLVARFASTIFASTGIVKGLDAKGIDIEKERAKWRVEFGEEDGELMAKYVYAAMPDYEYLHARRTYVTAAEKRE